MHPFTPVPHGPGHRRELRQHRRGRRRWPRVAVLTLAVALALVAAPVALPPAPDPDPAGGRDVQALRYDDRAARSGARLPVSTAPVTPTTAPVAPPAPTPSETDEIIARTNDERAAAGVAPLTVSACATEQAAARTAVLVAEDRFEHDPLEPVLAACAARAVGENLALGYPTPLALVAGWMGSEGHRANILNAAYTQIGVACTTGAKGPLCAQVFVG